MKQSPFECEAKNFVVACSGGRCKAHVISRQFREISAEPLNFLYICKTHEIYFNSDEGKKLWPSFVKEHYPEKYAFVCSKYEFLLNEYIQFLKLKTYFSPKNHVVMHEIKAPETVVVKMDPPAITKPLCVCSCHSIYQDTMMAYCWDCRDQHSIAREREYYQQLAKSCPCACHKKEKNHLISSCGNCMEYHKPWVA